MSVIQISELNFPIFKDIYFKIGIYFKTNEVNFRNEIPFNLKLIGVNHLNQEEDMTHHLSTSNHDLIIPTNGVLEIQLKINTSSMEVGDKRFYIEISGKNNPKLLPIKTPIFPVVNSTLHVETSTTRWYKDQGGKKNTIDLLVSLRDHQGRLVTNRSSVPLKLILHYEKNLTAVVDQNILTISKSNCKLNINNTGTVKISVRIEQVSRAHQHNKFVIRIAPDTTLCPRNNDIASTESAAIEVLSKPKPNKKEKSTHKPFQSDASPTKRALSETSGDEDDDDDEEGEGGDDDDEGEKYDTPLKKKQKYESTDPTMISSELRTTLSPENQPCNTCAGQLDEILGLATEIEKLNSILLQKVTDYYASLAQQTVPKVPEIVPQITRFPSDSNIDVPEFSSGNSIYITEKVPPLATHDSLITT